MKKFKHKDLCPLLNYEKEIEIYCDESKPKSEKIVDFFCDYAAEYGCVYKEQNICPVYASAVYEE